MKGAGLRSESSRHREGEACILQERVSRESHARFVVSFTLSDASWEQCQAETPAEQASNPGKREHPAPSAGRSVGKGVDQRGADDAAAILDRATRAETAPARSEIPEGRRRRALWVRSLPMTMTRNLC